MPLARPRVSAAPWQRCSYRARKKWRRSPSSLLQPRPCARRKERAPKPGPAAGWLARRRGRFAPTVNRPLGAAWVPWAARRPLPGPI